MAKKTTKIGDEMQVPEGAVVIAPSGKQTVVTGGVFFAEENGQYEIQHSTDEVDGD
jgi:hypothetical protein